MSEISRTVKSLNNYDPPTVDHESGCHRWNGPINPRNGYGIAQGRPAHRVAWHEVNGEIPHGMVIDHVWDRGCRYRDCVNVDHLELVTPAENNRRSWRKRKAAQGILDWESGGSTPPAKGPKIKASGNQRREYVKFQLSRVGLQ